MENFANSVEMYAQPLGLKDPWKVERAEFNEQGKAVYIYVTARKTATYECPICGTATVERFSAYLDAHKGDSAAIERVASDMSGAYKSGVALCFPNAKQTIDRFHVKKLLMDALN